MSQSSLDLSNLNGSNGFVINGVSEGDRAGRSVSNAGDVNGDGIDDLIIGADRADPNGQENAGESYVVFGNSNGFGSSFNLSDLNGSNGFVINGIDGGEGVGDFSGYSVSNAGDVNGDGIDDLIIGADRADPNGINSGESYVVFGTSIGFGSSLNLSDLNGSNGFAINGIDADDRSGRSVSNAGDVNGDGIDDLIIGADRGDPNGRQNAGESYVIFGTPNGFGSSLNLSDLNGSNGFVINGIDGGESGGDYSGRSVSSAGDINGDGVDDLIVGAYGADPNGNNSGESYVVFGNSSGFGSSLNLSDLNGSNGFVINGIDPFDRSGRSVSSAGDVNGDGIDDLIIGAPGAEGGGNYSGESYVVFGNSTGFGSSLNLSDLNGNNGFVLFGIGSEGGEGDYAGRSVSSAGDVNGDGIDDLIIGAPDADGDGNYSGESYVVFGNSSGFGSSLNLSDLNGDNGFVINGVDQFESSGSSASGAGDVNGDGIDDLIIGAPNADPNGNSSGESYVVFGNAAPELDLNSTVGAVEGFVISGADGAEGRSAGDVNGDGIDDLILGSHYADPNGNTNAGESYVIFGSSSGFDSSLNISDLNGDNGFVINGIDPFDNSGRSVSSAGDVNGDGIDDLIISAPYADPNGNDEGESYVVFGNSNGFGSSLNLSDLNGDNGFVINGIDEDDHYGHSVSSAGDVNGDGIDDLIIGASYADPNGNSSGESYVVFGNSNGFGSSLNLSDLNGSNGFVINGIDQSDRSGRSVSNAGDVNGDGIDDLIIGAHRSDPNGDDEGESYVVFGNSSGFGSSLNLSDLDGSNGFVINGIDENDNSGRSVSGAGDVNGDGIDDLIIGAPYADPNGSSSGESYVVFGSSSSFGSSLNLSDLDGSNGFVINGIDQFDNSGRSVSSAGDVNDDGIDDLIIGAPNADPNGSSSGESYVIFGNSNGFGSSLNLSDLDGSNGFVINGIDQFDDAGISVSDAGDINGDGVDDLMINAFNGDRYVVFGHASIGASGVLELSQLGGTDVEGTGFSATFTGEPILIVDSNLGLADDNSSTIAAAIITITNLTDGANEALGANTDGTSITTAYDADNGILTLSGTDTVANYQQVLRTVTYSNSAPTGSVRTFEFIVDDGEAHSNISTAVITTLTFEGFPTQGPDQLSGSPSDDTLQGLGGSDRLSGGNGNDLLDGGLNGDTLLGEGGDDTLLGGDGVDLLVGGSGNDSLLGGNHSDTLLGGGGNDTLLGGDGVDALIGGSGNDSLSGGLNNDTLQGQGGNDTLLGGSNNDLLVGASGSDLLQGGIDNDTLSGGGNNDTLAGQAGDDTLLGGSGLDVLVGAAGDDLLQGGLGNDTLNGGSNDDTLEGQGGFDLLLGGSGNDILVGGLNNDTLTGGAGSDAFRFDTGFNSLGTDTITDFASNDVLELRRSIFGLSGAVGASINASEFETVGSLAAAQSSEALIAYNSNDGSLYFNANGAAAGFGTGGQFAEVNNNFNLTASHIELIA